MADTGTLVDYTNSLLEADSLRDYSPNGLQVAGRRGIERLMTGVTACQALLESAREWDADAVLVHHGWFWKNEPPQLTGMKLQRVRTVLDAGFSLIAYHLPLDIHRAYGNNAELARLLGITVAGQQPAGGVPDLLWFGRLGETLEAADFGARIGERLGREPLHLGPAGRAIETVAWCTGAGQDFIEDAVARGVDAFITGEVSERTAHTARECGIHFFAAGHHATERYGVQALGRHLAERFALEHRFVDIDNPV
jgi:dinuclear metal center YbgI/SA1388 family protein